MELAANYVEKRRTSRINTVFPVRFRIAGPFGQTQAKVYKSISRDISPGGVCLETRPIEEETLFQLLSGEKKLVLDLKFQKEDVRSLGEITWSAEKKGGLGEKALLGVKFINLPEREQEEIADRDWNTHRTPFDL